jgi:pyruvate,water dikinase
MKTERPDASAGKLTDMTFRHQYEILRSLLFKNGVALQLMSDLEADLNHLDYSDSHIQRPVQRLLDETLLMAQELNILTGNRHRSLYGVIENIRGQVRSVFQAEPETGRWPLAVPLNADESFAPRIVGGKAAGLATLRQHFPDLIPQGFVITTAAYRLFIDANGLADRIRILLGDLDVMTDHPRFRERTGAIRELILAAPVPEPIREAIERQAGLMAGAAAGAWAVRSSAWKEDEGFSFAGQFDSKLNVGTVDLVDAYRSVLASRFSNRAVTYRLHCGLREVDTPMAVLFMPMIDAQAAGVIYTTDPQEPDSGSMVLCAVRGLADRMIRGEQEGEIQYLSRSPQPERVETRRSPRPAAEDRKESAPLVAESAAAEIGRIADRAAQVFGHEMDLEWALDRQGRIWLLQGRRLGLSAPERTRAGGTGQEPPLLESGYTLAPGRAEGPVECLRAQDRPEIQRKAPVLVIDQGTPAFAPLLPRIAALLIEHGNPVGHLAALVREFRVPAIYGLEDGAHLLRPDDVISVDATKRRIYRGSRWPEVRERVLARVASPQARTPTGPLYERVLALNLTDSYASSFKARNCRSIHDVIRFIHEMSIRSMFHFGDRQNRFWKSSVKRLDSRLPIKLRLVDLDGCTPPGKSVLKPEDVDSSPFQALWRGVADPRVAWDRKPVYHLENMPRDFVEQVLGGSRGPRRSGDTNYAIVAADYLNFNARFAFHYAMLDAIVSPSRESNHVHFRFRGGGGDETQRIRRATFLEAVLRNHHFGVDRRGDLVTAWLRSYPRADSERALEMLARLMACSRQLDMFLVSDDMIEAFIRRFLNEDYSAFR